MVRVGVAQIACAPGDVGANLARHEAMLARARDAGVDLLVFPELSLTGYDSHPDTAALTRPADASELRCLAGVAGPMTVVVGFMQRGTGTRPHNACAVLTQGRVAAVHRKLNLPTYGRLIEGEVYAPGAALDLFGTPLGPTACLVCADTWNPALPWLAALAGAEAFVVPVASAEGAVDDGFDSREGWEINLRHTAMTYGLPVIMANHAAGDGLPFWGGSTILDATGRVLARAGREEALLVAEVDPAQGRAARARLPTVRDADPALVLDLLGRLQAGRRAPQAARAASSAA